MTVIACLNDCDYLKGTWSYRLVRVAAAHRYASFENSYRAAQQDYGQ